MFKAHYIYMLLMVICVLPAFGCDRDNRDDDGDHDDTEGDDDNDDDNGDDVPTDDDDDDDDDNDNDDDNTVEYEYSIKVDDMPMAEVLPVLPDFARRGFALYLNVRPEHVGSADLAAVIEEAENLGLRVKLWPLLDGSDGSWCCEDNLELFWENVFATLDFVETVSSVVDTVVINVELGHPKIDLIRQYLEQGDYVALIGILWQNRDLDMFAESMATMRQKVDELHERGYMVQATTYPFVLDDMKDGDPDFQDIANAPVHGIDWDYLSFTPYTTAYASDFGLPFGPYFVYSYAGLAKDMFGDEAHIAVGIVEPQGYTSPEELGADVAAAKAAGVKNIDIYHLVGMLEDFDAWADAVLAEPLEPPMEAATILMHTGLELADFILDFMP